MGGVTSTPVVIDPLLVFQQNDTTIAGISGNGQCRELYKIGGNLYVVLFNPSGFGIGGVDIRIFKSTDSGLTWTAKDTANEPGSGGINLANLEGVFALGTKIYVAWRFKPTNITILSRLNSFDTTTDTWTGQSIDSALTLATSQPSGLAVLTSTDQYIISQFLGGGNSNLQYITFIGGVWSVATTDISPVAAGTSAVYKAHLVDATDTIHLIYAELVAGVSSKLYYVQISSLGVVGARTLLLSGVAAEKYNVGNMCFQGTKLVISYQRTSDNVTTVLIGTPLAAPVFSSIVVDPGASTVPLGSRAFFPCAVLDGSGNINVFWGTNSPGDTDDRIWTAVQTSAAAFGAPSTWYSNASFPPPGGDPFSPGIVTVGSPTILSPNFGLLWDFVTLNGSATALLIGGAGGVAASSFTLCFKGQKIYG